MREDFLRLIREATGARGIQQVGVLQELWSGYGAILRYALTGGERSRVVVKHIRFPAQPAHPRGWNTARSHRRKLRSYQVEMAWYDRYSSRCDAGCRVPACLALATRGEEALLILEDLDASGFAERRENLHDRELVACLTWLANFHARFFGVPPEGLWPQGTYWHLDTRPDELAALTDRKLQKAAPEIDRLLRDCPYQTLVHGDAKVANFCFTADGRQVAAVDFQYVGGGPGVLDLAYFLGSCLSSTACQEREAWLLDTYFAALKKALQRDRPDVDGESVAAAWRHLYPLAWADFHRFLKGWSPGHWKLNAYSEQLTRQVLAQLLRSEED